MIQDYYEDAKEKGRRVEKNGKGSEEKNKFDVVQNIGR